MGRKHFGTDGIRGRANSKITAELALKVGQAAGLVFQRGEHRHRVVIGKDTRLSSYMIEYAMVAGFASVGMDVLLLGPVPTPAVAMLTRSMRCDLGVMISASHNLFEDNGIKLFGPDGFKLSDEIESRIEDLLDGDIAPRLARAPNLGRAKRIDDVQARYIEYAKRTLPRDVSFDGLRIVLDCANGAAYKAAPEALWELGAEVIKMGVEPNGLNINLDVGSTAPEALAQKVRELRADIGIALDGDADRMVVVDEKGHIVDGDQILAVIAESWKADGRLAEAGDRGDRHVQSRPRAASGRDRPGPGTNRRRRPLRARAHGRKRHQRRRRTIRPHHIDRLLDHRRRPGRGDAGDRHGHRSWASRPARYADDSSRLPQVLRNVRFKGGRPLGERIGGQGDRRREGEARRLGTPGDPPFRHRAGDPGDGRGRRQGLGGHAGFGRLRCGGGGGGLNQAALTLIDKILCIPPKPRSQSSKI